MKPFPKPIKIQIIYDKELQKVTGVASEEAVVSEGLNFLMMLKFIFDSYPEIPKIYPPGSMGLRLNGKPPTEFEILNDGDKIELSISYLVN
jgi:hypothetical protein